MNVRRQWMTVGAVAALGVSGAVGSAALALDGTDDRNAGAAVVLAGGSDDTSSATDTSPESADSPTESATESADSASDSPGDAGWVDPSPESADSPSSSAAESAESDLRYTREKVDAGARFLITQLFFDNQLYYDFVARARDTGIDVPIIPGIMPITNVAQIRRFTQMCGASIPPGLLRELELCTEQPEAVADFGVAYATMQCAELLANGAPGIHFYTLNRSPATRAILSALQLMRPWERASLRAATSVAV